MFLSNIKILYSSNYIWNTSKYLCTNTLNLNNIGFNFIPKFTDYERETILKTLNESSLLSSLNISENKIKNLENYKDKKGSFKCINELLDVDGLNVELLEKIFNEIISNSDEINKKKIKNTTENSNSKRKRKQFLTPVISNDELIEMKSFVGIYVGTTGVSWAKLNRNLQLVTWGLKDFSFLPKKLLPHNIFNLAIDILSTIPVSDAYIFEDNIGAKIQGTNQPTSFICYSQQIELNSMLLALINTSRKHNYNDSSDNENDLVNRVYFLKSRLPARLFKTLVGNEKVSTSNAIIELFNNKNDNNEDVLPFSYIKFSNENKNEYFSKSSAHKELLGQALLLIVTFNDLCILQNVKSINALTSYNKR